MPLDPNDFSTYVEVIKKLSGKWTPHDGQKKAGQALLQHDIRQIFIQCGRNWGKTELIVYLMWRWAMLNPGSGCYYISPYAKQSREIVWASKRIQKFGAHEWIDNVNNTEMRITLKNGSFMKCDGSDNYEAHRGIKPHFVAYEEFKDFRPEYHIAMEPNLAAHNAPLIIIGTPPNIECQFTQLAELFKNDPNKAFFTAPSQDNPHIPRKWLDDKKKELYSRGEDDVWEREYMGRFVKGGAGSIFPMLDRGEHVVSHETIMNEIRRDVKKLEWYVIADPGTATVFGVLFCALNPYNKKIYLLNEIYETEQKFTSVNLIGQRILDITRELTDGYETFVDWIYGSDEAAKWFVVEMVDRFGINFIPSAKSTNKKEVGLSIIKDALLLNQVMISTNCTKLVWEMEQYVRDRNGNIPKMNDHLIDCFRYLINISGYSLNEHDEPVLPHDDPDTRRRAYSLEDDLKDWAADIL